MSKTCKYCGKEIEEGKICDCPESLENAARQLNNKESKKVAGLFKEYFKDVRTVTKKVINENNKSFISISAIVFIVSVILNFYTMFSKFAKDINNFINSYGRTIGLDFFELITYNLSLNLGKIILYGILYGLLLLLILIVVVLILIKIKKSAWNNKSIVYATIINTIPMSCFLIICSILQLLFSFKFIVLMQVFSFITFIVTIFLVFNIVTDGFNKGSDIIIFMLIVFLSIVVTLYIYNMVFSKVFGTCEINGQALSYYINIIKNNLSSEAADIGEDIFKEIFKAIIYGI